MTAGSTPDQQPPAAPELIHVSVDGIAVSVPKNTLVIRAAEEAGIEATELELRGTISWPVESGPGRDWFGFVFRVDAFAGEPPAANAEGTLHWVPRARLAELPLPAGDERWLAWVFDPAVAQFAGVMPYRDGRPAGWSVSILPA